MLKIANWNINSIRSRIDNLSRFIEAEQPDIILLQEIKTTNENFPYDKIEELGYNVVICGQKSYNGVAIISKFPIEDVTYTFEGNPDNNQARYIEAVVSVSKDFIIRIASVYVPNGSEVGSDKFQYKLDFLKGLKEHLAKLLTFEEILIIGGDYNVAPEDIDVYDHVNLKDTVCFHHLERQALWEILNIGLSDSFRVLHPYNHQYSWWDYRAGAWQNNKGMRIDYLLLSPQAVDRLEDSYIIDKIRGEEKASDHAPVIACFK